MADQDEQAALIAGGSSAVALAAGESVGSENFDLKHLVETLPRRDVPIGSLTPGFYLRQDGTNPVHVQLLVGVAGSAELRRSSYKNAAGVSSTGCTDWRPPSCAATTA